MQVTVRGLGQLAPVRGRSMIAVVLVCMSLHVFGCETEMVSAERVSDGAENVGAISYQVPDVGSAAAERAPAPLRSLEADAPGERTTLQHSSAHDAPATLSEWEAAG